MTPGRRVGSDLKKACFGSFLQVMSWWPRQRNLVESEEGKDGSGNEQSTDKS